MKYSYSYFVFTFMHLADAFIQSDLQLHSGYTFLISMCVPWESNPQPFALLMQCSTTEPHRNIIYIHVFYIRNAVTCIPLLPSPGSLLLCPLLSLSPTVVTWWCHRPVEKVSRVCGLQSWVPIMNHAGVCETNGIFSLAGFSLLELVRSGQEQRQLFIFSAINIQLSEPQTELNQGQGSSAELDESVFRDVTASWCLEMITGKMWLIPFGIWITNHNMLCIWEARFRKTDWIVSIVCYKQLLKGDTSLTIFFSSVIA